MRFNARIVFIVLMALLIGGFSAGAAAEDIPPADVPAPVLTGGEEQGVSQPDMVSGPDDEQPDGGWLSTMPLQFIRNQGQYDPEVQYTMITDGGTVYFIDQGVIFELLSMTEEQVDSAIVWYMFLNATGPERVEGEDLLPCRTNFLVGNDSSTWFTSVETYGQIRYVDLYPGIDLLYHGVPGGLKSEFFLAPGARPEDIQMAYEGQTNISLNDDGSLIIETPIGDLVECTPVCYQNISGELTEIPCSFRIEDSYIVGFSPGAYREDLPLVIDPVMKYGIYLRGVGIARGAGIAVDDQQSAYVIGTSYPSPYTTIPGTTSGDTGGTDIVVVKINPDGTAPIYVTYLGGSGDDSGAGIRVDSGYAYITGTTLSGDFPTVNAVQPDWAGGSDAVAAKITQDGTGLEYSTYLGGSGEDSAAGIALFQGDAYITGTTNSPVFPVISRYQRTFLAGQQDAYLLRLSGDGSQLIFSNYIGGTMVDYGKGVATDSQGYGYVTGETYSRDFPLKNPGIFFRVQRRIPH
jgi:hypothetical protein